MIYLNYILNYYKENGIVNMFKRLNGDKGFMETVKVFFLNIDSLYGKEEYLFSVLPTSRINKANGFVNLKDRLLSLAAGYLLYRYIGDCFVDEFGKPRSRNAFFSIAHSEKLAVLAVSKEHEIGIDIEKIRNGEDDTVIGACLNESELKSRAGENPLALFVAKESLAKADGCGLREDVKNIPAFPLDGEVVYKDKKYIRHTLNFEGYVTSVTLEGKDFVIKTEESYVI